MKRKGWILVQQLLLKRNSEPKSIGIRAIKHVFRLRGRWRLTDTHSVISEPLHARRIGSY